jgi:phage gpG-like protein
MSAKFTPNPALKAIVQKAARAGNAMVAFGLQKTIKKKLNLSSSNQGRTPSPAGQPPAKMTGTLGRSIQVDMSNPDILRVGTNLVYAKMLEYGGVIRPKKARALIVPFNDAARKYLRMNPSGPAGDKSFSYIKHSRPPLLAQVMIKGKGKRARQVFGAVFGLVRSTRMPERPYMRPSLRDYKPQATADFARGFRIGLRGRP